MRWVDLLVGMAHARWTGHAVGIQGWKLLSINANQIFRSVIEEYYQTNHPRICSAPPDTAKHARESRHRP